MNYTHRFMKVCGRQFTVNHHKMSTKKKRRSMSYFAPDVVVIVAILFGMPVGDVSRMHV